MSEEQETYSLPCGLGALKRFQSLHQLALRIIEIADLFPDDDAIDRELARRIDQFHADLVEHPRGGRI